eukprot:1797189-Alexandrium_andersonii.AAC.1
MLKKAAPQCLHQSGLRSSTAQSMLQRHLCSDLCSGAPDLWDPVRTCCLEGLEGPCEAPFGLRLR